MSARRWVREFEKKRRSVIWRLLTLYGFEMKSFPVYDIPTVSVTLPAFGDHCWCAGTFGKCWQSLWAVRRLQRACTLSLPRCCRWTARCALSNPQEVCDRSNQFVDAEQQPLVIRRPNGPLPRSHSAPTTGTAFYAPAAVKYPGSESEATSLLFGPLLNIADSSKVTNSCNASHPIPRSSLMRHGHQACLPTPIHLFPLSSLSSWHSLPLTFTTAVVPAPLAHRA